MWTVDYHESNERVATWAEVLEFAPTALHPHGWEEGIYHSTSVGGVTQLDFYPLAQVKRMVLDDPCNCGP